MNEELEDELYESDPYNRTSMGSKDNNIKAYKMYEDAEIERRLNAKPKRSVYYLQAVEEREEKNKALRYVLKDLLTLVDWDEVSQTLRRHDEDSHDTLMGIISTLKEIMGE